MLYKEVICPVCNGRGFISKSTECSISSLPCPGNCRDGMIVIPMTNADIIRICDNEQLVKVHVNLSNWALYSGGEYNRLLDSSPEDFSIWLNKVTDETDLQTIFDFIDKDHFKHPWTALVAK